MRNIDSLLSMESSQQQSVVAAGERKPAWLKTKITGGTTYFEVKRDLRARKLVTVCEEAKCPNIGQCWSSRTATFMVLGDTCTRACRFCHVKTGNPQGWVDRNEPREVAQSVKVMGLDYVVLTMVDRDDMEDGGASHVKDVICEIRKIRPEMMIEVLAGDFAGNLDAISIVMQHKVEVYAHNIETVERLSPRVRDRRADYRVSLSILKSVKDRFACEDVLTKSAMMLGLGETREEVLRALNDLRSVNCDLVVMGQYMRPTKRHLSVKEWVHPDVFEEYTQLAYDLGFSAVIARPLARSSYKAKELYYKAMNQAMKK